MLLQDLLQQQTLSVSYAYDNSIHVAGSKQTKQPLDFLLRQLLISS